MFRHPELHAHLHDHAHACAQGVMNRAKKQCLGERKVVLQNIFSSTKLNVNSSVMLDTHVLDTVKLDGFGGAVLVLSAGCAPFPVLVGANSNVVRAPGCEAPPVHRETFRCVSISFFCFRCWWRTATNPKKLCEVFFSNHHYVEGSHQTGSWILLPCRTN